MHSLLLPLARTLARSRLAALTRRPHGAASLARGRADKSVSKPIYNHITGALDPNEDVSATPIVIFEGLHPMYDDRVNEALDLTVYLDITDDVKFAWKAQRDIAERGATMEDVQKAIDGRKPDFAAFVEPQKEKADIICQVSCTTA
jgi:phosphoribulokinase